MTPPRRPPRTRKKKTARAADRRAGSPMPGLIEDGRAKVNLTLRVVGRRIDGYHDLESVVAFADCADRLTLTAGSALTLTATRPRPPECGKPADTLVIRARGCGGNGLRAWSSVTLCSTSSCRSLPVSAAVRRMPPRRCDC